MLRFVREVVRETLWVSGFLLRTSTDSLRTNTGWAVLALVLSAAVWAIVTGEQNPPKVDVFPSPIPVEAVNVPPSLGVLGDVQFVRVRISALPEDWARLTAGSFKATADLSGTRPGTQDIGLRVTSSDRQVRVLEVLPPRIPITVEALDSRPAPVKINLTGTAPLGVSIGIPKTSVAEVSARGPAVLVGQVESAAVDIPLDGLRVAINSQSFKLTPRSSSGTRIEGVILDPAAVDVTLSVEQNITYRSVSLLPALQGQVPDGYWMSDVRIDPTTATVAGAREALEPLTFLNTQPIDVSKLETDSAKAVGIVLPSGLTLVEPKSGSALVFVSVTALQGSQAFSVSPSFNGLSPDYKASADSVSVVITGPLPKLRQLKPSDIVASLDVKGLGPGNYLLRPTVTAPSGLDFPQPVNNVSVTVTKG